MEEVTSLLMTLAKCSESGPQRKLTNWKFSGPCPASGWKSSPIWLPTATSGSSKGKGSFNIVVNDLWSGVILRPRRLSRVVLRPQRLNGVILRSQQRPKDLFHFFQ